MYGSSSEGVASVTLNGLVKALKPGTETRGHLAAEAAVILERILKRVHELQRTPYEGTNKGAGYPAPFACQVFNNHNRY
ncbi:hypothetical protein ABE142_01240 [Paenibacillus alvei]|uniref:Ig-like domain-containing protein n=1 Tax=Paenibacillus alvei TaxID=44250 RepID=UPI003D2BDD09